ncbi:uncharacterized protein [Aegilops tauschii subsp. strangulata]|uniref:uncharacterized protein n=1 Tax=Aegilops tauschii subsp. strangulata TaxID=200361 RepID=UPI003CC852CC
MLDPGASPHVPKYAKLEFPLFDGKEDPFAWLVRCEQFFEGQCTPDASQVWLASFHLNGDAPLWYHKYAKAKGRPSWDLFKQLCAKKFGPPAHTNKLGAVARCPFNGSVTDYQEWFTHLLHRAPPQPVETLVKLFTMSLPETLRTDVELARPEDLDDAISLALAYERRAYLTQSSIATTPHSSRSFTRPSLPIPATKQRLGGPTVPGVTTAAAQPGNPTHGRLRPWAPDPNGSATTPAGRAFCRLSPTEIAERRKQGLCFNCDEQFVRGHRCAKLFSIEVDTSFDDDFETLPEEENCVKVSIQAMTSLWSIQATDTLQLEVLIGNSPFTALLDIGSTHNFIDESALTRAGLTPRSCPGLRVMVANGDQVASGGVFRGLPLHIGEQHFTTDCSAIPLGSFDIVLGVGWLRNLGPILWDFDNMTVSFHWEGQPVTWTSRVLPRPAVVRALVAPEPEDWMTELLAEFDDISPSLPPCHLPMHMITEFDSGLMGLRSMYGPTAIRNCRRTRLSANAQKCCSRALFASVIQLFPHQFLLRSKMARGAFVLTIVLSMSRRLRISFQFQWWMNFLTSFMARASSPSLICILVINKCACT